MSEALKILKERLEQLQEQEAQIRKENMKLQDRTSSNAAHLSEVAKQVVQFKEAIKKLED